MKQVVKEVRSALSPLFPDGIEWLFNSGTISTEFNGDFSSSGFAEDLIFLTGYNSGADETDAELSDGLHAVPIELCQTRHQGGYSRGQCYRVREIRGHGL